MSLELRRDQLPPAIDLGDTFLWRDGKTYRVTSLGTSSIGALPVGQPAPKPAAPPVIQKPAAPPPAPPPKQVPPPAPKPSPAPVIPPPEKVVPAVPTPAKPAAPEVAAPVVEQAPEEQPAPEATHNQLSVDQPRTDLAADAKPAAEPAALHPPGRAPARGAFE